MNQKDQRLIYRGEKFLWLAALVFHWSLLIILIRHLRLFVEPVPSFVLFLQDIDGILQIAVPVLFMTNILVLIALTYLVWRRIFQPQIRYISLPADYVAPLLLLAVIISGIVMRFFFKVDIVGVKELAMGIISFNPSLPSETLGLSFYAHIFLVSALLAYFPYSKMMHMAGVFLSPTRNLANTNRMQRHINPWNYPVYFHTYEEWEDEFRRPMKAAGLPLEKE